MELARKKHSAISAQHSTPKQNFTAKYAKGAKEGDRVLSLRLGQGKKSAGELCLRLNLSHHLGESGYDALRRGRMLKSRTCASRLERCIESSLSRH